MNSADVKSLAKAVISTELSAIQALSERIDDEFVRACEYLLDCKGRIIITGIGKSGHVGSKIAATFASTGSPAFFVHSGEANHGDLGMITASDVVIAISNSGETDEILTILPHIKRLGVALISITGNEDSRIAQMSDVHINGGVDKEACPLNLAPTASTTVAMVLGDALAISLLEKRGFTEQDFARSHPGGALGRKLLLHVHEIMCTGEDVPTVTPDKSISEALVEMTQKGQGMTFIVDNQNTLLGIFTDGDLRRTLDMDIDLKTASIQEVMTANPHCIPQNTLAAEALGILDKNKINSIAVTDHSNQIIGALSTHDLLRAGVL